jgi:hypothetical protein
MEASIAVAVAAAAASLTWRLLDCPDSADVLRHPLHGVVCGYDKHLVALGQGAVAAAAVGAWSAAHYVWVLVVVDCCCTLVSPR